MTLVTDTEELLFGDPEVAALLGIQPRRFADFADLAGVLLGAISGVQADVVRRTYAANPCLVDITSHDIAETARRNFEPGGAVASLLFARGVHAVMAHRVAHQLWRDGDHMRALAVSSSFGRAFSTEIHPGAQIGPGFWLDHGVGFVAGETCMIGQDVSIWHNVTLGSTLSDSGPKRHPTIGDGAVIGAGATILGNITVGAGANVAAGTIVVADVAPGTVVVGAKARVVGPAQISFRQSKE
ncbi:serine acetyltransferase [Aliishimia ponticola]|uniref:serine O-acetyltransferase n=1 Tax=Aliishimia ponticola TaxID=2499833 RepID=A0A4S4N7K2_9RHOB|nr:serine O-acetyltransferase EpsC [Aliishimia ponticola]THH35126.1 serine acetyltransferase [Aliishimia ponticola]